MFVCLCMSMSRCLASETECDKLRERANELRRKVDDMQAALLELGRENQSLQVLLNPSCQAAKFFNRALINSPVRRVYLCSMLLSAND